MGKRKLPSIFKKLQTSFHKKKPKATKMAPMAEPSQAQPAAQESNESAVNEYQIILAWWYTLKSLATSESTTTEFTCDEKFLSLELNKGKSISHAISLIKGQLEKFSPGSSKKTLNNGTEPTDDTYRSAIYLQSSAPQNRDDLDLLVEVDAATIEISVWTSPRVPKVFTDWIQPRLVHVLKQICEQDDCLLSEISIICPSEREVLSKWRTGGSKSGSPSQHLTAEESTLLVHEMFEQQANQTPEADAIQFGNSAPVSYKELNSSANQLARLLRDRGVARKSLVPLCLEKSVDMVVAQLAVQKAGAAWVPLDTEHPQERINQILAATKAKLVITTTSFEGRFQGLKVVNIDNRRTLKLDSYDSANLNIRKPREEPCHVLFTSGSSGTPKGVVIGHDAEVNCVKWLIAASGIDSSVRTLQFAAYTFDVGTLDILMTLSVGGCLFMDDKSSLLAGLNDFVTKHKINYTQLTPTVMRMLDPKRATSMKCMLSSGEALTKDIVEKWSHIKLVNAYGPTETDVCTVNYLDECPLPGCIGRPNFDMSALILDEAGNEVPIGVMGELCIAGPQVYIGYLDDEEKTAESYINTPSGKFYKTGDYAAYDDQGRIHCRGRIGNQVKLRGQRIELEEIEHHMGALPDVRDCMVHLRQDGERQQLVAFLSLNKSIAHVDGKVTPISTEGLRELFVDTVKMMKTVSEKLPQYMVPTSWIFLESIPLTASGKINRVVLKTWVGGLSEKELNSIRCQFSTCDASEEKPVEEDSLEGKIQKIWSAILNTPAERISVKDSFMALGGDSISAIQVVSKCRQSGIGLSIQDILTAQTIEKLVPRVKVISDEPAFFDEEVFDTPFELSPIQKMHFELRPDGANHYNQGFLVRLSKTFPESSLKEAIEKLTAHHSMLRARFQKDGSEWKQYLSSDIAGSYSFSAHDLQASERDIINAVRPIVEESQKSLDICNGPILHVDLFHANNDQQVLFLTAHHLVVDLVSWRVILDDLETLLNGNDKLPRSMSFQNWAKLQQEYANSLSVSNDSYPFNIPKTDNEFWGVSDKNIFGSNEETSFSLDRAATSLLLNHSNNAFLTEPIEILLATLGYAFHKVFPERPFPTVFDEKHGREPWADGLDVSRTVGWFTSMYPLPLTGSKKDTVLDVVRQTKDTRRRILQKARNYFSLRYLNEQGIAALQGQQMEIMFNYQGQYQQLERADGIVRSMAWMELEDTMFGANVERYGIFEVEAAIKEGELKVTCNFNKDIQHKDRVYEWIGVWSETLQQATKLLSEVARQYTATDYPGVSFNNQGFGDFVSIALPKVGISLDDDVDDMWDCTPVQRALLVSAVKNPDFYKVCYIMEIFNKDSKSIDLGKLEKAWAMVIAKHQILRTVILDDPSGAVGHVQVVLKADRYVPNFEVVKARPDLTVDDTFAAQQPFDFSNKAQPPHRLSVLQTTTGKVFCKIDVSHVITDGWSLNVIFKELLAAYHGQLSQIPRYSFQDQVGFYQELSEDHGREFWSKALASSQPSIFSRLGSGTGRGTLARQPISLLSNDKIQKFCNNNGITLPTFFRGVWAMVLYFYANTNGPSFGYTVSGRDGREKDLDDAVGLYINTIPCYTRVEKDDSTLDFLRRVQNSHLDCLPFQLCPLGKIQKWAGHKSDTPLFNTLLTFEKYIDPEHASSGGLSMRRYTLSDPTEYDVVLRVISNDEGYSAELDYWNSYINTDHASTVAEVFADIADAMCNTSSNVTDLYQDSCQVPTKKSRSQSAKSYPSAHALFEKHVSESPESICMQFENSASLTSKELNHGSDTIASKLLKMGVQAKSRVATCLEISIQSLQIFIALLKIGAVYVPLDSKEMPSKLRPLAERCKADFVITSSKTSRIFERIQQIRTNISIEKLFSSDSAVDETTKPKNNASPSDVCCIGYESTENGHKEVVLTHGMMSTAIVKIGKQLAIDRDTRYLQASTWTLSMFDILCVLVHGGCVVLTSRCENSGDLSQRVSKFDINTILLSSTALYYFDMHNDTLSQLRSLIIGRETSRPTRLKHLLKNVAVHHVCGQAETGGWRRVREIKKVEDWDKIKFPTVGHHWVLKGDDLSIVPDGAMGELCYSGPDLAGGCISESAVGAVVRTGNLVRCTSDGDIEFLGRKEDSMVINGQSINVFEVEKAFSEHASSELSFSIINTTRGGKPVLAAFVVLPQTNHSSKGDAVLQAAIGGSEISGIQQNLREKLVASLATVAIPTLWIPIRILPRTSSDSLDRNALRKLLTEELISIVEKKRTKTICKPKTLTETILYEQWKKLLSLADDAALSIDDNFFQLGGDSLMAMKLSAGLSSKLHISVLDIFENPTIRSLGRRLDSLSSKKLEKVEVEEDFSLLKISKEEVEETKVLAAKQCGVSPDDIIDIYPCSPLQEGLTVESMKDARLNVGKYVFTLPPKTDISRLRNAWEAVIDGNEILRTRIVPSDNGFIQVVLRHEELEFNTFEKADYENALEEFVQNDELHKISPPKNMMKLTLLTVKGATYLVWTIHHAIYDGISTTMILGDLFKAYNGNPITQRPKYRTFIHELLGSDGKAAAQYWESQVTGQTPNVWPSVPRDYSPGTINVDKFYLKTNLMSLSESLGCTGATLLRAGWGLVAGIHAGTDDITFGVTNSGRNFSSNASVQDVNGPCIVTLPLRINKDSNHSIRDYIKGQMARDREMMRREFFGLQEISKINDELKAMCNFGSLLVVQNTFQAPSQLAEDTMQLVEQHGYIGYPLVLECSIIGAGNIEVTVHYDESILSTAEIGFLIGHFENAILAFEKPETSVGDINYINKAEYEQIMKWCEAAPEPSPGEQRQLHQIFEEQATLHPNAPAVQFEDEPSMSYSELNQEANKFARHLQSLGVLPKEVVAICLDRGVRTIVVILGILKAGAGYVPLDSEHPPSRLQGILDDCQSKFVVTKKEYRDRFEGHAVSLIEVDDNVHGNYDDHNLGLIGSTAYVIFTSGSTGKPKGVAMSHLAAVKSCQSHNHISRLSPGRRVFGVSTYTFDASIFDYFTTLLHGGCLCLASKSSLRNLAKMIDLAQADTMFLTPTVLRLMNPSEVPSLKMIILGGEPPSASDIEIWGDCLNLVLCYGPTEACVYSSLHPHAKPKVTPPSSLGWPVGSKNWVLDQNLNILPVGVPGELHLSGYPLADGYIGDTEKTNKVFVPSPFEKGQRLYKTGDYVQWNADGSLRFFARIDNLVKIHGLRIELGDIEHNIIQAYPGKKIMVDVIRTDPTNPILTAFIEVQSQKGMSYWAEGDEESRKLFERLEEHAVGNLPRYMVPKVWVPVAEFPQTTSGKTDRKTMLKTFSEAPELIKKYTIMRKKVEDGSAASFSGTELKLKEFWAKILSLGEEEIGAEDDFFVLGGDSLAAIRVGALCMRNELDLTITDIFKHRTIRKLAKLIEGDEKSGGKITKSELVKPFSLIDPEELSDCLKEATTQCRVTEDQIEDVYPCTSLQQGMIALSSMDNGSYFAKQAYLLSPSTDIERFRQAWALVTQHNPILRTRFIDTDSGILQVVLKKEELKWEIDSHESFEEYCARSVDCEDIYGQNLSQFHLFKRAQDGGWHFVWTSHHSLYDGMSVGLFMSDLYDAYDNLRTTRQFTPYNQFIKYLNGIKQKELEEFWKTLFTDITPTKFPAFPTANYRPRTTKLFRHQFAIPKKTLNEVSVSEYVRSAWALVTSILSETDDTSFGVTLSGRNAPLAGIDEVNGPTITTFPTRIRVGEGLLAHEFLSSVHEQVISAIPYEHTGIQNVSTLSTDCKTACEFRSLLVAQPAQQDMKSSGLSMAPVSSEIQHSYAIVLESMPSDGSLELVISYDGNILEEAQIARITASVETAIKQLMTSSEKTRLSDISIFTEYDRKQVEKWNGPCPEYADTLLHEMVEHSASRYPHSDAVCASDGTLSYSELDSLCNRLASKLVDMGIGAEDFVPFCIDKSTSAIVTMLAIMKAGAGYVFLNPDDSSARLEAILDDVKPKAVLVSQHRRAFCESLGVNLTTVDDILQLNTPPSTPPAFREGPRQSSKTPAYIIYTSGSTGKPKGVVIEHGAIATALREMGMRWGFDNKTRMFQFTSYSWDVHVLEVFGALTHGGCICVPSEEDRLNDIPGAMNNFNVNTCCLTPSVAALLQPDMVPSLEFMITAGEPLKPEVMEAWAEKKLCNAYGPTEASVICAAKCNVTMETSPANIGETVGGLTWVVDKDDHDKLVPVDTVGELVISGHCLARGYLGDDEKTNAVFIQGPTWLPNGRIYKTGDLVRYNTDGTLLYLGRKDRQVKMRGIRIELGELESYLSSSPLVSRSAVLYPKTGPFSGRLVAAFCLENKASPDFGDDIEPLSPEETAELSHDLEQIKTHVRSKVPKYMWPNVWLPLRKIPLMVSGKIHYKSLMAWISNAPDTLGQRIMSPSSAAQNKNPTEQKLVQIWSDVFKIPVDKVSTQDSFFTFGGDLHTAINLMERCRDQGLLLTAQQVLQWKTIAELALLAKELPDTTELKSMHSMQLQVVLGRLDISQAQIESVYSCTSAQRELLTQEPTILCCLSKIIKSKDATTHRLQDAWKRVVSRHTVLRTIIIESPADSGDCLQVVLQQPKMDIRNSPSQTQENFPKDSVQHRVNIYEAAGEYIYFEIQASSLILDSHSMDLLVKEVMSYVFGQGADYAPAPFQGFVEAVERIPKDHGEEFWYTRLGSIEATSFPKLGDGTDSKQRVSKLSLDNGYRVQDFCKQNDITATTFFQAVWSIVLRNYTGSSTTCFGNANSGRHIPAENIGRIIGPCSNVTPCAVVLDNDSTIKEILNELQESSIKALEYSFTTLEEIKQYTGVNDLFDTVVAVEYEETEEVNEKVDGNYELVSSNVSTGKYPVILRAIQSKRGPIVELHYRTSFLSQQKVSELEDVVNYIINAVIENPKSRMESIEYDVAKIAKKRQPDTPPATPPAIEAHQPSAPKQTSNALDASSEPMEERLRSLWSKVLRMPGNELEAESQFFEIGGDSIKAMRLVSLARKSGIPLTVKDIFTSPGLGQMAIAMASLSPVESKPTAAIETKKFSLIKTDNLQNFIENIICPQISAKCDMIEDIYPATYFQSLCAVNSMKPSRGYNVYFNFDIKGDLDIPRLEKACREVVQTHPILRTVFAIHNNSFLQVVLRKPNFIFSEHDLYDMRDATISTIIYNDKRTPASFGDSNIRFFIFRSTQYPGQYRFTVRILHALYDGLGFPRLWGDINSAYQGQVLKPAPDYASYISLVESRKLEGRSAWTQELAGSSMTRIISRPPNTHHREAISGSIISSIPQISFTNISRHGITFPTLLKASWASVLARHTNTTDVTFGYLTSGRNIPVDNITDFIGPCINLIPIRIQFPRHRKVSDLLHHIHQTHICLLPYETSSFADIVKHCTNWPENTTFSSVVQHQDLEGGIFQDEISNNGPGLRPTSAVPAPGDHVDCWVTSRPTGKGGMDLEINFAPNSFPRELAERLGKELKETLVMFAANPDGILELALGKEGGKEQNKQLPECSYQKIGGGKIRMALQEAWIEALGVKVGIMEAGCFFKNEMDFFRMGGDSFMALKMVVGLNRRGFRLTVGDVYEDSTFGGMLLRVFEGMEGEGS